MLGKRGEALTGVDCELAVILGELLVHDARPKNYGPLKTIQTLYAATRPAIASRT
jgi:hypothetical protein